ncbi:Sialin isoform 2 [Schistosoma japonicum]|uniref:Sialin isoform 2 n=2 Tax=Schistosoma japonicum TaxID=6182 RepID=A0A4Z2CSR0_SCHJA|nr:Sialin isoform 2 [Schistosoma japonicum]
MKCLSERMILSLVLCLGTINMLAQRVNLSIAILCMTNHSSINENDSVNDKHTMNDNSTSSICSIQSLNKTETMMDGPFVWDRSSRGILLGIIFWGYFLGQIPAGILIQKFSVRLVLLISLILMSTSTILVPLVATKFLYLFYAVRVLTGLTSASWFPGFYQLWAAWAPPNERGLLIGFAYAGLHIGSAISMPITGALCQTSLGWSLVFYFYGAFSFLYCIIWFIFVYDEPKTHPRISLKGKIYLESSCPIIKNDKKGKIPFKSILTSLPVWAFVFVNIGIDWNLYTFLTSVPTYMREVLHFDFQRNALLSSIPYIGMWIGQILFGWLSDIFLTRRILTLSAVRKLMNSIGMFGPAVLMILITLFDCRYKYVVVILLTFGLFLSSGVFSGGMLSPIEITPKYSGFLFSASNSVGALTGFLTPVVANALTPDKTFEQWRYVFYLGAAIFLIAGLFFLLFSSFTVQSWAIEVTDTSSDNDHSFIDKTVNNTIHSIDKIDMKNHDEQFDQIQLNEVSII